MVKAADLDVLKICPDRQYNLSHSEFRQGDPSYLSLEYEILASASFCFVKDLNKALLLGLGAGDFLCYLSNYFQECSVDVVEINPAMIEIVKKFREKDIRIKPNYICDDAIMCRTKTNYYDLIHCDIYFSKPWKSDEYRGFFEKLKNSLTPNGALILNAHIPFIPRAVVQDLLNNFSNIVAAVTNDGFNIVFICYNGIEKTMEELEKKAQEMQEKYCFRSSLLETLKKFRFIKQEDRQCWIEKFPQLE